MGVDFLLRRAWKIILLTLAVTAMAGAIISILDLIGNYFTQVIPAVQNISVYFLPDNFSLVMGVIISVRTGSIVYARAIKFIQLKIQVLN